MPIKIYINFKLSSGKTGKNREAIIICLIQHFEANFLRKVGKTFTHASVVTMVTMVLDEAAIILIFWQTDINFLEDFIAY